MTERAGFRAFVFFRFGLPRYEMRPAANDIGALRTKLMPRPWQSASHNDQSF
jgi:hypothetical protein